MLVRACTAVAALLLASCRGPLFHCEDVGSCDLLAGGVCEDNGYCSYADPACASGQRFHAHAPAGISGVCVDAAPDSTGVTTGAPTTSTSGEPTSTGAISTSTSTSTGADSSSSGGETSTGAPGCAEWEQLFADEVGGKVTDVLVHPDGGYLVASTGDGNFANPGRLLIRRLDAAAGVDLEPPIEVGQTLTQNYNNYIRMPRITAGGDLLAVFSWLNVTDVVPEQKKRAPALIHLELASGDVERDDIVFADARAIRRAAALDDATLLLTGARYDELWYARVSASVEGDGHTWKVDWSNTDALTPIADGADEVTVQGLALLDGGSAMIGGTIHTELPDNYVPWLRRISVADGEPECECKGERGGVMALATSAEGELFFGGFRTVGQVEDTKLSQFWFGKLAGGGCPLGCATVWDEVVGGRNMSMTGAPETSKDVAHAVLAGPGDRVLFAGVRDEKPFLIGYTAAGKHIFDRELKDGEVTDKGVVYAIAAVPEDSRCVVVAGVGDAKIWVRQLVVPD